MKIVNLDVMAEDQEPWIRIIRDLSNPVFDLTFDTHVDLGQAAALVGSRTQEGPRYPASYRTQATFTSRKFDVDEIGHHSL